MSRAFHKAKLPLWYTEGFNPHVFLTFAAPLSLGFEGRRESMDIRLIEEMPYDIRVYAVTEPKMKGNDIANAEYVLRAETGDPAALQAALEGVLAQPELLVQKHTKKGERTVDIRPYFADMRFEPEDGCLAMTVRLPAGNQGGINPTLFIDAAEKLLGRAIPTRVERTGLFDGSFREFQ